MTEKSQERLDLEGRATELGLKYPGNIGDDKLTSRIAAREEENAGADNAPATNTPPVKGPAGSAQSGAGPGPAPSRKVGAIVVIGPKEGRRRAGYRFGQEPVEIPASNLSKKELAALMTDPTLAVSVL